MANYKNTEKITFSQQEEKRFRQLFNQWAASVEGYNRNKLGDELKIVQVYDTPLYRADIRTQYDSRWVDEEFTRLRGRNTPSEPQVRRRDVNLWSMAEKPTSFTNNKHSQSIAGSHYSTSCHTCHGSGYVTCSKCGGKGKVTVAIKTKRDCTSCNGRGYKYVTKYREEKEVEYFNGQSKWVYKKKPYQAKESCYYCNGKGYTLETSYTQENCENCGATGKVTCSTCGGEGKIVKYLEFNQTLYTRDIYDYRFPSIIAREEASKIIRLFNNSTPWKLVENFRVEKENFETARLKERPFIGAMLWNLAQRVQRPKDSTEAICFNNVWTYECEAKTVTYEVDGKSYTCVLLGDEWRLCAVTSPISDKLNDLKEEVNNYCSKRQYGKAWAILRKVCKYPQAGSNEAYMQEQLEERMSMTTKLGANIAIAICAMLVTPIIYQIYDVFDFYAVWSKWLMKELTMTNGLTTAISIFMILWLSMKAKKSVMPKYTVQVASSAMRFTLGFIIGICHFIMYTAIILLCAYTGILQLISCAVFFTIAAAIFIVLMIIAFFQMLF